MSSAIFDKRGIIDTLEPVIPWKGRTFNQITSSIKKNPGRTGYGTHNLFLANPLKLYRREIATPINERNISACKQRSAYSIDEFDRPGGSIVHTVTDASHNGLVNTIDMILPNNTCEEPGTCLVFLSPAENAKRRCRSAGMVRQKYNQQNKPAYFTDAKQYLHSRNYTYDQNQFRYPVSDPSYCTTYKPNNRQFSQQGGVSASSLIARTKYNTIQTAAVQTGTKYGPHTANALAYGTDSGYTMKDVVGYPIPTYPAFKAGNLRFPQGA